MRLTTKGKWVFGILITVVVLVVLGLLIPKDTIITIEPNTISSQSMVSVTIARDNANWKGER